MTARTHSAVAQDPYINHSSMRENSFQPGDIILPSGYQGTIHDRPENRYVILGMTPTWGSLGMWYLCETESSFSQGYADDTQEMIGSGYVRVGRIND